MHTPTGVDSLLRLGAIIMQKAVIEISKLHKEYCGVFIVVYSYVMCMRAFFHVQYKRLMFVQIIRLRD